MANERNNKRGHGVRNTAIAGAALLLLLGGGRYGLGIGRGGGEGALPQEGNSVLPETAQVETAETTAAPEETAPGDDGVLEITVREDALYYEGEALDLAALRDALLRDYAQGVTVKLTDDHAIKSAYDEVAALLTSLGIEAE